MSVKDSGVEECVARAPYQAPTLSAFGPLTRLTAGGSGQSDEGSMRHATPTRRPMSRWNAWAQPAERRVRGPSTRRS